MQPGIFVGTWSDAKIIAERNLKMTVIVRAIDFTNIHVRDTVSFNFPCFIIKLVINIKMFPIYIGCTQCQTYKSLLLFKMTRDAF